MVNNCFAFNQRYMMFSQFLSLNNKIIVFIPTFSKQISPLNHNCNALNVFLPFLAIIMRGQKMVIEQSENDPDRYLNRVR